MSRVVYVYERVRVGQTAACTTSFLVFICRRANFDLLQAGGDPHVVEDALLHVLRGQSGRPSPDLGAAVSHWSDEELHLHVSQVFLFLRGSWTWHFLFPQGSDASLFVCCGHMTTPVRRFHLFGVPAGSSRCVVVTKVGYMSDPWRYIALKRVNGNHSNTSPYLVSPSPF